MIARSSRPVLAVDSPPRRLSIASASPRSYARLFGAPTIETPHGPLTGRAVQRHRIALVALLATSRRGARPRDQIIDLLWPDADAERGRRLLSDSIYRINAALGAEAISTRGDSVELDGDPLSSDVIDWEHAFAGRDWARVIALHQAPFLDGFYLSGAVEFDQWMEAQRTRFERSVAKAIESVSADARGLAVLPFRYIGTGDAPAELAEVLAEETIAAIGRRTTIPVVSQLSSFALREVALDARELGRRLNVAWIVEGSVRTSGDAMRIVARLTDATNGYQVWTESFDFSLNGAVTAEVWVAESIASGIGERLLRGRETSSLAAR